MTTSVNETFKQFVSPSTIKVYTPSVASPSTTKEEEEGSTLLDTVLGISLDKTWLGITRQCDDAEKMAMLREEYVVGDKKTNLKMIRFSKYLINTKHPEYRSLTKAASRVRSCWHRSTTPWVKDGIRVLKKSNYESFMKEFKKLYDEFDHARNNFADAWGSVVTDAKNHLGKMFDPAVYPNSLDPHIFEFTLDYPSLIGDSSVEALDPAAYAKMKQVAQKRLEEACAIAEKAFAANLQEFISRLTHALTPEYDSKGQEVKKRLSAKTLSSFKTFYEEFKTLKVSDHHELDTLFQKAIQLTDGVDPKTLKDCKAVAEDLKKEMQALSTTVHVVTGAAPPIRKLTIKKTKDKEPVAHADATEDATDSGT